MMTTMGYVNFSKKHLINLGYSLNTEILTTNHTGSFASTTVINCNTRKYHGLLASPVDYLDGGYHMFLSSLDETIVQEGNYYHLAVHKYPGVLHSGHKYITGFSMDPIPAVFYTAGDVELKKEFLLMQDENRLLVRYTILNKKKPFSLWLHPFLAFRNIHSLSKANPDACTHYKPVKNGIVTRLYAPYPDLYMQISRKNSFLPTKDWFYNVEYEKEMERGYQAHEDLYVPGYFELNPHKNQSVIFSAGFSEAAPNQLARYFNAELKRRSTCNNMEQCLKASAGQFTVKRNNSSRLIAHYPWAVHHAREAFMAMPGLLLTRNKFNLAAEVMDDLLQQRNGISFKDNNDHFIEEKPSVDTALWFFWAVQQFAGFTGRYDKIRKSYWEHIKAILDIYHQGTDYNIGMDDKGLLHAGDGTVPLTWMNSIANGEAVTPRSGFPVEVNALWYNALKFALELAERFGDNAFVKQWAEVPQSFEDTFEYRFWHQEKAYLIDVYNNHRSNYSIRPNQVLALSLPYVPVRKRIKRAVLYMVEHELLTSRGLRTLAPGNGKYIGIYLGNAYDRAIAAHQGTIRPWLFGHFAEAYLKEYGKTGLKRIRRLYRDFEQEMTRNGIGSISEMYDGNSPHHGRGAISSAVNVAELLRTKYLLDNYST